MTLTMPPGPLATQPTSARNYRIEGPAHRILFEPHPRRYRAEIAGHAVIDTTNGHLLHESQILPVLYVPLDDFDRTAGEVIADAAWHYPQPLPDMAPELAKGVSFMGDGIEIELADPDRFGPAIAPTGAR